MTTPATSIPKKFWLHLLCTEEEMVRPHPTAPPPIALPQDPQACSGAISGPPSAFLGPSQSPPGPHRGKVARNQSP